MFAAMLPLGLIRKPVALPTIVVSRTNILTGLALPEPGDSVRPDAVKPDAKADKATAQQRL